MELKDRIKNIVNYFEKIKEEDPRCGDVFCGTCGGYGAAIRESMDDDMHNEVSYILDSANEMDIDDITKLYEWNEFLSTLYGKMGIVRSRMLYHEGKKVDLNNVRELDNFLFDNRWNKNLKLGNDNPENFALLYDSMLKAGMDLAIRSQDTSLSESIFIILGNSILEYPDFVDNVLAACPDRIVKSYFNMLPAEEREKKRNEYNIKKKKLKDRKRVERQVLIDAIYTFYTILKEGDILYNSMSWNSRQFGWFLRRTLEAITSENMTDEEVKEYLRISIAEII